VITDVPADMPLTIPVLNPIVATPVLLLVHVPPPTPSLKDRALPIHTVATPPITVGDALTVTVTAW
jgi:hypothetical protein